ncbi:D-alanine--D-alanyl carrier protein ligase [Seminavis robusta]|uniref:D-alanine--D-alanyl carrier protein ligase n=1 Tax=Seminavis robusta TaxID=568900 RepID=A0A9N8EW22_9STRA|nr:D-alanine--D-alanyl carrier protein ligase [Seminavis robusta]|eukprot:Sro1989_g309700.1 D-alanine--D-alanyl carrier protein ligase (729) ;mRNA; f:11076-13341
MKLFSTIVEALNHHASETPDKVVFTWVNVKCEEQDKMTFKQLEDQSNAVSARLLKLGCKKGDRVMIAYPFGLEFLAGMFGAMKVGVIPCSIYPPNPNQLKTDMPKFRRFAEDAGAKYALSTNRFATAMTAASVLYKTRVKWIGTDKLKVKKCNSNKPTDYETFMGEPNEICFIQYTSGSTGRPKGVMVRHHNLAQNCRTIGTGSRMTSTSVTVLCVPQYHDMGIVGGFMSCLYAGAPLVLTSPLDFLSKPIIWSDMIETYQATHTCAPNFAYALLLKQLKNAKRTVDWSCLEFAGFSAEPTQHRVVEDVAKTLSVRPGVVHNLYGLAEAVVWLTGGPAMPDSKGLVCCGKADSPTIKLRIVQDGKEVEDGQVGSIWAHSPSVTAGYYGQPELTTSTFANVLPGYDGTWLDTGDLGKIVDGQLYVTGRVKDVIIINGKNYYPSDVELSIDDLFGDLIRPGRTTAFQHGEDSVGITVEGRKDFDKSANEDLTIKIANHVAKLHGLFASEVVVLKGGEFYLSEGTQHEIRRRSKTPLFGSVELPDIDFGQTNTLPSKAVEAVHAVECNPNKLDDYYPELNLDEIPDICEAWSKGVKTTEAMKTMCSQLLKHLEDKQPTICQLAHTLSEKADWILIEDRTDFLFQLVHQVFVLQWVTTFMMGHPECMQQKLQNDAEWESTSQSILPVPVELQELLGLPEEDPMHGTWPFFTWMKNRSVRTLFEADPPEFGIM